MKQPPLLSAVHTWPVQLDSNGPMSYGRHRHRRRRRETRK